MTKLDLYSVIELSHQMSTFSSNTYTHESTLELIGQIIGSDTSVCVGLDEKNQTACASELNEHKTPETALDKWLKYHQNQDPFFQVCLSQSNLSSDYVINSEEVITQNSKSYMNSNFYNEFMLPHSFYHMLSMGIPSSTGKLSCVIALQRSKQQKAFSTKDTLKAKMLVPIIGSLIERVSASNKIQQNNNDSNLIIANQKSDILTARLEEFRLSKREAEVVSMVHKGLTNVEIAEVFHLSVRTVSNHLHSIYEKTGVHNRTALLYQLTT